MLNKLLKELTVNYLLIVVVVWIHLFDRLDLLGLIVLYLVRDILDEDVPELLGLRTGVSDS